MRHRATIKLSPEHVELLQSLHAEHPYVAAHRVARAALTAGLQLLARLSADDVRTRLVIKTEPDAPIDP